MRIGVVSPLTRIGDHPFMKSRNLRRHLIGTTTWVGSVIEGQLIEPVMNLVTGLRNAPRLPELGVLGVDPRRIEHRLTQPSRLPGLNV